MDAIAEELAGMALDPTLDACCRRDLKQQASSARLRSQLMAHDPSQAPLRARAAALQPPPSSAPPGSGRPADPHAPAAEASCGGGSDEEASEGDDGALTALRRQRLRQLKVEASARVARAAVRQLCQLHTVPETQALEFARGVEGRLVLHLAVAGHEPCNQLDEHLRTLAGRHPRVRFARTVAARRSPLAAQLQLPGVPALVCFIGGGLVGRAPLVQFGGGSDLLEEQVDAYLVRLGMLKQHRRQRQSSGRAAGSDDSESDGEAEGSEAWQQPCDVCGRTYPHEHVRSVYSTQRGESESDSSGCDER